MEAHLRQKVHELLDRQSKVDMQEAEFSSRFVISTVVVLVVQCGQSHKMSLRSQNGTWLFVSNVMVLVHSVVSKLNAVDPYPMLVLYKLNVVVCFHCT